VLLTFHTLCALKSYNHHLIQANGGRGGNPVANTSSHAPVGYWRRIRSDQKVTAASAEEPNDEHNGEDAGSTLQEAANVRTSESCV